MPAQLFPESAIKADCALLRLENEQRWELIGRGAILCGWRGSVAHGTHVSHDDPDTIDDVDLMSVIVPGSEYYFGLKEWGSSGTRELTRRYDDKLGPVIYDAVHYEFKKFMGMIAKGNPNVFPLLWMDEDFYVYTSHNGQLLLENRQLFSTKLVWHGWRGYAKGQLHQLHKGEYKGHFSEKRRARFEQFGYDCKAAAHLVRLLRVSLEFFETGEVNVYRSDHQELLAIKQGQWTEAQVREEADRLLPLCEAACAKSRLPDKPDMDKINKLSERILMDSLGLIRQMN